jgi:large subunit ribosomal protein L21e
MVKKKGIRRKSRDKLSKNIRDHGKISLRRYMQALDAGDRVALAAEPAYHKGLYHPRFHGKVGTVLGKQGRCYKILFSDINKEKMIIVHPVHLKLIPKTTAK